MAWRFTDWRRLPAGLMAVWLILAPAAAQVPDPFARQLAQKLARAESAFSGSGFVRGAGPFAASLSEGQTARLTLTLRAGEIYRLVGVCDLGCGAPELSVRGEGTTIARAPPSAQETVLDLRVPFTGAYEVEVALPRCAARACWYAVNVYSR
jgi:hypothetical protein